MFGFQGCTPPDNRIQAAYKGEVALNSVSLMFVKYALGRAVLTVGPWEWQHAASVIFSTPNKKSIYVPSRQIQSKGYNKSQKR